MSKKPNLFIAGAPKCGTHALYYFLKSHPKVFMSDYKAPHHFDTDILIAKDQFLSEQQYLDLFKNAKDTEIYRGESNGWNFVSAVAAKNIKAYAPDARILIMLRNPFDAIPSMYHYNRLWLVEDQPTLEAALRVEDDRAAGRNVPKFCNHPHRLLYSRMYRFSEQLPRYIDAFGADRVHVILHDDLKKDTLGVFNGAYDFLGLERIENPDFGVKNPTVVNRSQWVRELSLFPPAWLDGLNHIVMPSKKGRRFVQKVITKLNSKPLTNKTLSAEAKEMLMPVVAPQVEFLNQFLGRDLSKWLKY
ncbi:MAG: sulfotransferase family protein [Saprospiraceae bacterium]